MNEYKELCGKQKSVKPEYLLYFRFFNVANVCFDGNFALFLSASQSSHLECLSINRCALCLSPNVRFLVPPAVSYVEKDVEKVSGWFLHVWFPLLSMEEDV